MRSDDIKVGMFVKVKGHIGVVRQFKINGFCGDDMSYQIGFTGSDEKSSVHWWVTADEIEAVRGV